MAQVKGETGHGGNGQPRAGRAEGAARRASGTGRRPHLARALLSRAGEPHDRFVPVTPARAEVVAVFGPTASGKSAVAEAVAERLGTEVVSADAMQVYRGLPILTNQPSTPTRLVGIRALDEEMSLRSIRRARPP